MYLMYIDESGDTISISQKGKKFLVLSGCVIHEEEIPKIEEQFRKIKYEYYQNYDVEIKSNFLRYANPDLVENSPLKLNSRQKYDALEKDISDFLKSINATLYSIVIHKDSYWDRYPAQNPYHIAYIFLLERFQKYLSSHNSLGICIIDPREGQTEKHFIGNELNSLHEMMRHEDGAVWRKCPNIIEKLLFSQSDKTVGIQIADLFCYPIFHVFEYNKTKDEYWRFRELSYPKFYRRGELVDGHGLKYFPDKTKKDLRFFSWDLFSMGAAFAPRPNTLYIDFLNKVKSGVLRWEMLSRVKSEDGIQLSTICKQLKFEASDGKQYETDCADTEGLFRIVQSIPSPKAKPFKRSIVSKKNFLPSVIASSA